MELYKIEWKRSAAQELEKLPKETIAGVLKAIEQLTVNPYPPGARKLVGSQHSYRLREGSYRIIYTISSLSLMIEIIRVGHRKDVYKR
ncbi:MAG: mRNA interferase RelE/StbE [Acidobacteriota bacterium]|jgi:mRNA interferase RelE/StbE|nr:mRNA interferase RelE/StbE [Acidobacteriota bacterium]